MRLSSNNIWNPSKDIPIFHLVYNTGLLIGETGLVGKWNDNLSGSTKFWGQTTESYKPQYVADGAKTGSVQFDGTDNWITGDQITIADEFCVGMKFVINTTATNDVIWGDTTNGNTDSWLRINDTNTIGIKTSGSQKTIDIDEVSRFNTATLHHLVICRNSSDLVEVWVDGAKQTATATSAGDLEIDSIGARGGSSAPTNFFNGNIFEFVAYNKQSDELAKNLSEHLMSIDVEGGLG